MLSLLQYGIVIILILFLGIVLLFLFLLACSLSAKTDQDQEALKFIQDVLQTAQRLGAETDEPEGVRYIQISDTLARKMSRRIETVMLPQVYIPPTAMGINPWIF